MTEKPGSGRIDRAFSEATIGSDGRLVLDFSDRGDAVPETDRKRRTVADVLAGVPQNAAGDFVLDLSRGRRAEVAQGETGAAVSRVLDATGRPVGTVPELILPGDPNFNLEGR